MKKRFLMIVAAISAGAFLYGCGGEGEGTTPTTTSAATQSASAASAATKSIISSLGVASSGGVSKPSSNLSDPAKIRHALKAYKASVNAQKARLEKSLETVTTLPFPCSSGTQTVTTDDKNTPSNPKDDSITTVSSNCVITSGTLTITTNGTLKLEPTASGFLLTFTNFSIKEVDSLSKKVFESGSNGTLALSGAEVPCGTTSFLENGTLTVNLTGSTKVDATGDGIFEVNESFTATNFTLTIAEGHTAPPACAETSTTLGLSGSMSVTDNVTAANNSSASFSNFTMVLTPATRTINGTSTAGETLSISGTVSVTSDCVTGTFTLSTPSNALPFVPDNSKEECPVDGKIVITGSGGASATVIFTSTAGARIKIDEGSDGTIDKTFADCESAKVCT